jgi:hypothetical protein
MSITTGWAPWATVRHGLDGMVWAALATGVAGLVLLARVLQPDTRRDFRA